MALSDAASGSGGWIGTWAAAPQGCGTTFNQQTLRQIVHTSIAGTAARVQFSNAYGTSSVDIADVHIAQRTSDSSIDPTTDVAVTFGGQASTTVSAGGVAVSDVVDFRVGALSDVVVSMYLPQSVNVETCHQQGTQTNYVASGDVSGSATLNGAQTTASYYLLANLDVQNSGALGAVVALGASITDGYASAQDANHRWPNLLATRLAGAGLTVGVLNQGINANKLLIGGAGDSALDRFQRDVISQPGVRWVIFSDDPINDLGGESPTPTADQLTQAASQLIASAHQAGITFLCSTLTPFQGSGGWSQAGETSRDGYDAFVRGQGSGCDAVVDQDTATHDPSMATWFLPADDSGDHLHPNDQGRQDIANAVPLDVFAAAVPPADAGADADATAAGDSGGTPPPHPDSAAPPTDAAAPSEPDAAAPEAGGSSEPPQSALDESSGCRVSGNGRLPTRASDWLFPAMLAALARLRRTGRGGKRPLL
jgi:lysophospholipase L1-like esterase